MDPSASASPLEGRKKVRLRLRADLATVAQRYEGRTSYVVKDPVSLRYYHFKEQEYFLLRLLDGRHTLDEAQQAFEKNFRPTRLTLDEVEVFAQHVLTLGLAHNEAPRAGRQLFDRGQRHGRLRRLSGLANVLSVKLPLCDPDRFLDGLLSYVGWLFTPWLLLPSLLTILSAGLLVASHFDAFCARLPAAGEFFRFQMLAYLWLALGAAKVLHELGHGLSCKAFGGEVHELGALLLCFSPSLYCDVSDAWTLRSKWQRILISFAGIYVELMIASVATFVWWNATGQPFLSYLSLALMTVCSANTLLFNGNPLLRFDGYYMLADWLEIPNLRDSCHHFFKSLVLERCLGIEPPPGPPMAPGRRVLFVTYAVASFCYRAVVTCTILWFLYQFLKPYHLGAVSVLLACWTAGSMAVRPALRLGRALSQRRRLPKMKPRRVLLSAAAVAGVAVGLWQVPLPVGRVRQTALVELQPDAVEKVFVASPATLKRLYVREGQRVQQGELLAEFSSLDLETRLAEARTEYDVRTVQLKELGQQLDRTVDPADRGRLEVDVAAVAGERDAFARQLELIEKMIGRLALRAPRAGIVIGPPRVDEVGKYCDRDPDAPFCRIGSPAGLRALMPVSPADYSLLKEELARTPHLEVTIRAPGTDARTWRGQVSRLPESEAADVPLPLTSRAGGPLPVQPASRPGTFVPQAQQYLVAVDFLEADGAVYPGTLAQVKVHCRWHTCSWWLWRTLASVFDLGFPLAS